jgi:hypothetical protein
MMLTFMLTMVVQKLGETTLLFCCFYMVHGLLVVATAASRLCETCRCDTISVLEQQSC